MTLPPRRGDGDSRPLLGARTPASAAGVALHRHSWAERPSPSPHRVQQQQQQQQRPLPRDRRRAVCASWHVGYGALTTAEEGPAPVHQVVVAPDATPAASTKRARIDFLTMPGLKSLVRRRNSGETGDTAAPLVKKKEGGRGGAPLVKPAASLASLRKCETVVALAAAAGAGSLARATTSSSSSSAASLEPLRPTNRLRAASSGRLCSRCSSLLTLASGSRYSLNASTGGFVPVPPDDEPPVPCKLCLGEVPAKRSFGILGCGCSFCSDCMRTYVEIEIAEGAYDVSCPDAQCPSQGVLSQDEIRLLVGDDLLGKHRKYRLNREIEIDKSRTWCPQAGCETVCALGPPVQPSRRQQQQRPQQPQSVHCPTCALDFCSGCKLEWHGGLTCDENNKRLARQGKADEAGIPFDSDLIKCCPMCNVPIEKDEGCAQMMCKRCKHVFCWYCLASLDDDFLLRHYDKGPCKNKLGHSRASVIWHRTQVIGIFAGFGILLLVASPLLLLAAPCIVCCKCRFCNAGPTKLDNEEELPGESSS